MVFPSITAWQDNNWWLFWVLMIINIFCQITLLINRRLARTVPINYIMLGIITLSESYFLSMIVAEYTPQSVFMCALITTAAFVGMTFQAVFTRSDLTIYGTLIAGMLALMIVMAVMFLFTAIPFIVVVINVIGAAIAMLFVVIDTQLILQKRKYNITLDDYIVASLILYLDFVELFIHLLRIFGEKKK